TAKNMRRCAREVCRETYSPGRTRDLIDPLGRCRSCVGAGSGGGTTTALGARRSGGERAAAAGGPRGDAVGAVRSTATARRRRTRRPGGPGLRARSLLHRWLVLASGS